MIVFTADRPPELRDVGAPQTIDQTHLYGRSVRWFHDPGVPDEAATGTWRSLGARAFAAAATGPVHLNLPFREPLVGEPGPLPARRPIASRTGRTVRAARRHDRGRPPASRAGRDPRRWGRQGDGRARRPVRRRHGLARAGRPDVGAAVAARRHRRLRCRAAPRAAGPRAASGRRRAHRATGGVQGAGPMGRRVRRARRPGRRAGCRRPRPHRRGLPRAGRVADPGRPARRRRPSTGTATSTATDWRRRWTAAASTAETAIDGMLGPEAPLTEPAVARTVARHLPDGAELVVASSMPVRDLEWFGGVTARAHANRGANGIDGVVSTALGHRPRRSADGRADRRHRVRPRRRRPHRAGRPGRRPPRRRRRQRRRRDLLVPPAGDRAAPRPVRAALRHASRHRRRRPRPAAHGLDAETVTTAVALVGPADVARPVGDARASPTGPRTSASTPPSTPLSSPPSTPADPRVCRRRGRASRPPGR